MPGEQYANPFNIGQGKFMPGNIDELVKSKNLDGKVKSSSSRRREFRGMRRT